MLLGMGVGGVEITVRLQVHLKTTSGCGFLGEMSPWRRSVGLVSLGAVNRPRVLALLAVSALLVSACSGDDDITAPTTTLAPVVTSTTVAPETTAAPTTTAPETTVAPTTPPPTAATTTEPAPATTSPPTDTTLPDGVPPRVTFPDDPDKQAVVDAFYAYDDALVAALRDPTNELLVAELLATVGEPQASTIKAFITEVAASGEESRPSSVQPGYAEVVAETVFAADGIGTLDACIVVSDILIVPGGSEDGSDLVLEDSVVSIFDTYSLALVDNRWRVTRAEGVGRFEGQIGCD